MNCYGAAPGDDEIEITVFGPGFGEAIAVHVGIGNWLLVDSCIDPNSKQPASYTYLQKIGVQPHQVKAIVASHWHDDHVKGISTLAAYYPDAEFHISAVFDNKEAMAFLCAYNETAASGLSRGSNELYKVLMEKNRKIFHVMQRSSIMEVNANGKNVKVVALSPVSAALTQSIAHFAQYLPNINGGSPVNHAPELKPNLEAIAIHIDFDGDAALLGSDLEEHHSCGWSAIVTDHWCGLKSLSSVYKVAHHGSITGEHSLIWTTLLTPNPTACLTPFMRGNVKLPTDSDKDRIKGKALNAFISSGSITSTKMHHKTLKRLNNICRHVTPVNSGFGAVRLRKKRGEATAVWTSELFGDACAL